MPVANASEGSAQGPTLQTERLILRLPAEEDFAAFLDYSTSDRTLFVGGPKTPAQARDRFDSMKAQWASNGYGRFILLQKDSLEPLGHVGPLKPENAASPPEITWTLWSSKWEGYGYASEAAAMALKWSFETLSPAFMDAFIHPENTGSRRIAERLNARYLGEKDHPTMQTASIYRFENSAFSLEN